MRDEHPVGGSEAALPTVSGSGRPSPEGDAPVRAEEKEAAKRGGLTGTHLKWFAVISMLIDHTGATVVEKLCLPLVGAWYDVYLAMRLLGRLAFPLYCFLLVEGFVHTHSRKKYALRLALFALASEIPFDLAFNGATLEFGYQNVFFTLLLGFLAIWGADALRGLFTEKRRLGLLLALAVVGACGCGAEFLRTDYGMYGVFTIAALYLLRAWEWPKYFAAAAVLFLASAMEVAGYPAFWLMHRYNGQRGAVRTRAAQYAFYVFYPAHLLVLGLIVRLCR